MTSLRRKAHVFDLAAARREPVQHPVGEPNAPAEALRLADSNHTDEDRRKGEADGTPRVWAVGGGKGGIGKTLVASSLALSFSQRGRRCILIDADLGAANLHTIFGVEPGARTLAHFFGRQVEALSEIAAPTGHSKLSLVSGARALSGMANPTHAQKQKLIRQLRKLPADDVVLDLSAGSNFTALDFFLAADHGVLVVTPEATAVENAYHFLHMACFRALRSEAADGRVRKAIDQVLADPKRSAARLPRSLIHEVSLIDAESGARLQAALRRFNASLILNETRGGSPLAWEMKQNCRQHLGIDLEILGEMPWDDGARRAIERKQPMLDFLPQSPFSTEFQRMVSKHLHVVAPIEDPGSLVGLTPGAFLAWYRKNRGQSHQEISISLRIREGLLRAIEEEDTAALPSGIHLHAWLSQYAQHLEVPDPEALVRAYLAQIESPSTLGRDASA